MIKHIQHDDLDKPPQRERLPDYRDGTRRPDATLPAWLWPAVVLSVAIVAIVVLILIWPSARAVGGVFQEMLGAYREHIKLALFLAFLAALAGAVAFLWRLSGVAGALGQRARVVRLQNDQPVDAELLRRPEWGRVAEGAILEHYLTQRAWADKSGLRNLTTAAPHIAYRNDMQTTEGAPALLPAAAVPSFGELVSAGRIGVGIPLLLGLDAETGEAVTGSFKSLYSVGVGGLQGSGKTWTMASVLAQSALHGARLVVCDPHAGDEESLATRVAGLAPAFLCDIAEDDRQVLAALQLADAELHARKGGAAQRWPLIVAVDEWTALRRGKLAQLLPVLVEDFSTEGRKFNCHVALLAQRWDKAAAGDFRNTLASAFVHRLRPDEARMLTGLPAGVLPRDTMGLAPGESYLVDTRGQLRRVHTPRMTVEDVAAVGRALTSSGQGAIAASLAETRRTFGFHPAPVKPTQNPSETQMRNPENQAGTPQSAHDPTVARILALWADGKSIGAIVKAIHGEISGPKYNQARDEVEAVIRHHWKGGA